jgi:YGGT family
MRTNPYSDEPTARVQPNNVPPRERMEDLPARSVPVPAHVVVETIVPIEGIERNQEEARTFRYAIGKLSDFLQWFTAVMESTLAIRFLLKLIGADPANLFAGFLYALTDIVLFPFNNIVRSPSIHPPYQSFEWPTLIAMAIYFLAFWAIRRFLLILITTPEEPEAN